MLAAVLVSAVAAGCQPAHFEKMSREKAHVDDYVYGNIEPLDTKYYASDEPLRHGFRHFYAGDFGLAQQHFQKAVEDTPRDATAWVGLAASYDRLRRFDLADQAYEQAIALNGQTIQILNNQGYSRLLRGDLRGARQKFLAAYEMDPENATIQNNLELLSSSAEMVERHPPAY